MADGFSVTGLILVLKFVRVILYQYGQVKLSMGATPFRNMISN